MNDRTTIDAHEAAIDKIQSGEVEEGDVIEVKYESVNGGETQTESGTVTHAEVVEAGTTKGKGSRTWEVQTTFYLVEYEVEGKNDHKITGERGGGAPKVYTDVGGRHSDGGDRRLIGRGITFTVDHDDDPFDDVTGDHDDDYPDTVEVVGTRDVERRYSGETETTAVLRYTVEESATGRTLEYDINAVSIGCPECKTNTTSIIRPDGRYECGCGYTNGLTRGTLFHQQTEVGGVWEPY